MTGSTLSLATLMKMGIFIVERYTTPCCSFTSGRLPQTSGCHTQRGYSRVKLLLQDHGIQTETKTNGHGRRTDEWRDSDEWCWRQNSIPDQSAVERAHVIAERSTRVNPETKRKKKKDVFEGKNQAVKTKKGTGDILGNFIQSRAKVEGTWGLPPAAAWKDQALQASYAPHWTSSGGIPEREQMLRKSWKTLTNMLLKVNSNIFFTVLLLRKETTSYNKG